MFLGKLPLRFLALWLQCLTVTMKLRPFPRSLLLTSSRGRGYRGWNIVFLKKLVILRVRKRSETSVAISAAWLLQPAGY